MKILVMGWNVEAGSELAKMFGTGYAGGMSSVSLENVTQLQKMIKVFREMALTGRPTATGMEIQLSHEEPTSEPSGVSQAAGV